jgi:hypothetical protein
MAITVTNVATGGSQTVVEVLGYSSTTPVEILEHVVIGTGVPVFTVKPARSRRGSFRFLCLTETTATTLYQFLKASAGPFTLADSATNLADTTFFITGSIGYDLDDQTRKRCIVSIEYTEAT